MARPGASIGLQLSGSCAVNAGEKALASFLSMQRSPPDENVLAGFKRRESKLAAVGELRDNVIEYGDHCEEAG